MADFCEHCEGQRFDRAQVLRTLRRIRRECQSQRGGSAVEEGITLALKTVAALEIPHLEIEDPGSHLVH